VVGPGPHEKVVDLSVGRDDGPSLLWPGVLVGIVSDGLFHLFSTAVLIVGIIQLVERRRRKEEGERIEIKGDIIQLVERRHPTPDPPRLALTGALLAPPASPAGSLITLARPDALRYTPPPRRPVRPHRQPEWRSGSASDS
jgi:hypothetical protein